MASSRYSSVSSAYHEQCVPSPFLLEKLTDTGNQGQVGTRQDGQSNHVDIFLDGGIRNHLRRLMQSGVDHLHAGVTKCRRHDLGAPVVSVEPWLGDENTNGAGAGVLMRVNETRFRGVFHRGGS